MALEEDEIDRLFKLYRKQKVQLKDIEATHLHDDEQLVTQVLKGFISSLDKETEESQEYTRRMEEGTRRIEEGTRRIGGECNRWLAAV